MKMVHHSSRTNTTLPFVPRTLAYCNQCFKIVVILWDGKSKEDMESITSSAFAERGILPHRTKVGRDIIFRRGDPCCAHDLVRVAAHKAMSIMVSFFFLVQLLVAMAVVVVVVVVVEEALWPRPRKSIFFIFSCDCENRS